MEYPMLCKTEWERLMWDKATLIVVDKGGEETNYKAICGIWKKLTRYVTPTKVTKAKMPKWQKKANAPLNEKQKTLLASKLKELQ